MSKFQMISLGVFVVLAVGGLVFFSAYKGSSKNADVTVTMWGTLDGSVMKNYFDNLLASVGNKTLHINYSQYTATNIYSNYLEALASGSGPDLLLLPQNLFWHFSTKVYSIPYSNLAQKDYESTYIGADKVYLQTNGFGAVPFAIDPLVMYWNKDIFSNALLTQPPVSWSDITQDAPLLTVKDASLNITTSAVSMGEYANIDHAKEILSLLFLQNGSPIVQKGQRGYVASLPTGTNVLAYYTQFADPLKQSYTWNRALRGSQSLFVANRLALYFGLASEYSQISQKNPNLNYDVALVPQGNKQIADQPVRLTYGDLYGVSVARSSKNPAGAVTVAMMLGTKNASVIWSGLTDMPSDRNDSLNLNSNTVKDTVFSRSALWAATWMDPSPVQTDAIFKTMIESVTSGRLIPNDASQAAESAINNLLN